MWLSEMQVRLKPDLLVLRFDLNQRNAFFHNFWAWRAAWPYPWRAGYCVCYNRLDFIRAGFHHDQSAGSDLIVRHGLRSTATWSVRLAFDRGNI